MSEQGYRFPRLIRATLVKRYKRFLADVVLEDGQTITVHCPNSGSMRGCAVPGSPVWLSKSDNPKRKYAHTWELAELPGTMVGINTLLPNRLVKSAVENQLIADLSGYDCVRQEVKTSDHTRLDLMLEKTGRPPCYVEIKNCTLVENGRAMFPDAVTTRGQKHLKELMRLVDEGSRGVIFFLIQRMDADCFRPAHEIDPDYAQAFREATACGVEALAMDVMMDTRSIRIAGPVPICPDME